MLVQRVAQIFGVVFLLVGLLGLVTTPLNLRGGLLLGLFPVNVLHNLSTWPSACGGSWPAAAWTAPGSTAR
jgi:Domain of unknown function (DUF4383)